MLDLSNSNVLVYVYMIHISLQMSSSRGRGRSGRSGDRGTPGHPHTSGQPAHPPPYPGYPPYSQPSSEPFSSPGIQFSHFPRVYYGPPPPGCTPTPEPWMNTGFSPPGSHEGDAAGYRTSPDVACASITETPASTGSDHRTYIEPYGDDS